MIWLPMPYTQDNMLQLSIPTITTWLTFDEFVSKLDSSNNDTCNIFSQKKLFTKQFWSYVATRASVCGVNCDSCINYFSTTLTNCTQQKVYIFVKRAKDYTYNQKQYNSWTCKQTHNNTKRWECHETNSYNNKKNDWSDTEIDVSIFMNIKETA